MGIATGAAFDRDGNLFVGDRNGTIFKIAPGPPARSSSTPRSSPARRLSPGRRRRRHPLRHRTLALAQRLRLGHRPRRRNLGLVPRPRPPARPRPRRDQATSTSPPPSRPARPRAHYPAGRCRTGRRRIATSSASLSLRSAPQSSPPTTPFTTSISGGGPQTLLANLDGGIFILNGVILNEVKSAIGESKHLP
jgi:hypothetical protein